MNAKDAIKQVREEQQPPEATPPASATPPGAALPPEAAPAENVAFNAEGAWEPWMQRLLDVAHSKFVAERVNGFKHPTSGVDFPPVPAEEAEARWLKTEQKFKALIQNDPDIRAKFAPAQGEPAQAGTLEAPPAEAAATETEPPPPQETPPT